MNSELLNQVTQSGKMTASSANKNAETSKIFASNRSKSVSFRRKDGLFGPRHHENDEASDIMHQLFLLIDLGLQKGKSLNSFKNIFAFTMETLRSGTNHEARMAAQIVMFGSIYFKAPQKKRAIDRLKAILLDEQWLLSTDNYELISDDIKRQIHQLTDSMKADLAE